jgi:predicted AlkP superfamily pyrophosphatase or phosphodiesterase
MGMNSKESDRRGAILLVIDGCRSDALIRASVPHIDSMVKRGSFTPVATTVQPTATLPVHFSLFSSLPPEDHGVMENGSRPMPLPGVVTITERVRASGGKSCAFFNWEPLRDLAPAGCMDHILFMANLDKPGGDLEIASAAAAHIVHALPDFAFVYLGNVDIAGHDHGFMSREYLSAVEIADAATGLILTTLARHGLCERYNMILQSDHGGVDHSHHHPLPEVITVPWLACGPDIHGGVLLSSPVSVLDTAPTLARLLGIAGHESWKGRVLEDLLRG